jgi:hypothetical protein
MKITFSDKLLAYLALLSGLSISAVAVWYSVAGLVSIFAAAAVPIIIMGVTLEVSKLVATVWLKVNWKIAPVMMRTYLVIAIIILMFITSMGIFGFLSKAHLDQAVPTGDVAAKIAIIDEKINTARENIKGQKDNIEVARKALAQMDAQVNARLDRSEDERGAERAVQIRRNQAKERKVLQAEVATAQKEIEKINNTIAVLNEERAPIASELRKVEAEVGPIKYIAALVYGDNPDTNLLEKAVRWVIIIIVLVFDPLAVVLLLASQYSFQHFRRMREENDTREGWHQEWVPDSENPWHDIPPLTDEQLDEIKRQSGIDQDMEMREEYDFSDATRGPVVDNEGKAFFERGKELARAIDDNDGHLPDNYASTQAYLYTPMTWFKSTSNEGWVPKLESVKQEDPLDVPILEGEEMWAQEAIDSHKEFDAEEYYEYLDGQPELEESDIIEAAEENEKAAMHRWKEEHPDSSLKLQRKLFEKGVIEELPWHQYLQPQPDFTEEDRSKKKDIDLDGNSGRTSGNKEQRIVADTYIQNAEQGNETLWQRIKKGNE